MNAKRPVAPEGFDATSTTSQALAVVDESQPSSGNNSRRLLILGLIWGFIGSVCVPLVPLVANVLIAFGMIAAMQGRSVAQRGLVLLAALAAGAAGTYLLIGAYEIPSTVLAVLCAFVVALLYESRKLTTNMFLLVALAVTAIMVGSDVVVTHQAGTSIGELFAQTVDQAVSSVLGTSSADIDTTAAMLETKKWMVSYWPTLYFVTGLGMTICSLAGAWLAIRSRGERRVGGLVTYDLPLWVAEVFALGVAAELLGSRLSDEAGTATLVGANVVLMCRIVLMMQGISVLLWWMAVRRRGVFSQAVVVMAALWVEMSFALTSMVGLLDTVVNFRRLKRGRRDMVIWSRQER